jgi:prepilin-type N-terminal cleavage/methylation domain-containing protein
MFGLQLTHGALPFRGNNKGFSMIELMVVMIIAAVLLSIAIGVMLDMRQRSYVATIKSDLAGAFEAAMDFHTHNPSATATLNDLRDHGFRESLNVTTTVVNGDLATLKITATHVAVSGVYQVDENGHISQQ